MLRASVVLREQRILAVHHVYDNKPAGKSCRRLYGIRQARANVRLDDKTVDDNFNVVLLILLKLDALGKVINDAVSTHTDKAALARRLKLLLVLALPAAHHRRQNLNFRALRHLHHPVDDLIDGLLADLSAADRAVRHTDARVQKAQIIVNFRHRAYRGTRVFGGCFLVDGNGRRKAVNVIDIRLFHLPEEHTGIA